MPRTKKKVGVFSIIRQISFSNLIIEIHFRYFRLPPNKRTNYQKLSIASPFKCNWAQLIQEWSSSETNENKKFFVLRDINVLKQLDVIDLKKKNSNKFKFVNS